MSWVVSGITVTDEAVRKMIRHERALRDAVQELQAAEIHFAEAATTRLERKHKLDEIKAKLRRLAEQGPDAVEQQELPLFDDEMGGNDE